MEDDMSKLNADEGQLPLLVGFSVLRIGDDTLPGHYDSAQDVWVIDEHDGAKPIVEVAENLAELATKTFAEPERDDPDSMAFLEASTKTEARPERDDVTGPSLMALIELVTKTKAMLERDDR